MDSWAEKVVYVTYCDLGDEVSLQNIEGQSILVGKAREGDSSHGLASRCWGLADNAVAG